MNNLGILLKNNFNILIGQIAGKKKRKSTQVATALLILGAIGIIAIYTLQAYSMFNGLSKLHLEKVCMFHAILTTLVVICIIGIMRTSANAKNSDSDFLLSLPIKKRDIIISKTINKYFFDFFFAFTLFVPFLVLYQVFASFDAKILLLGLLFTFLCPFLSIGISYICDFIITRLFNRMRLGGILKSFTILLLFVLIMALLLVKTFTYGTADYQNLDAYFADRPISNFVLSFLFDTNVVNVLGVILGILIPFVWGMVLYSMNYGKTFASYSSNSKVLKFSQPNSTLNMLFKKEISTYATTPAYIINTIIGPVVILVVSIFLCTMGYSGICDYFGIQISKDKVVGFITLAFCLFCATAPISACSISLEGKNMWLLKSSPINEKQLFSSKVCVHLCIVEPCILVGATLLSIFLQLNILQITAIFILPTLANFILAFAGTLINLWQPNLDWDNETKVVKQSLSVLLTMVLGVLLAVAPYGIYKLCSALSISATLLISIGLYAIVLTVAITLLYTIGVKMFREL